MLSLTLVIVVCLAAPAQEDPLGAGRRLIDQGQLTEAERVLQAALEDGGGPERDVRLLLAEAYLLAGRPAQAIEVLDALELEGDAEGLVLLGRSYMAQADAVAGQGARPEDIDLLLADARAQLERAAQAAPEDTSVLYQLGTCELYRFADHVRALEIAEAGLAAAPDDPEMLLLRGCARVYDYWNLAQSGDDAAANEAWNAAVDDLLAADKGLPRERIEAWGQLAWLYEVKGIPNKAVEAAIAIVDRQDPPNFDTLYRLAKRYCAEGRWDAAGKAMEKMVTVSALEVTQRLRQEQDFQQIASLLAGSVDPFQRRNDNATSRNILAAIVAADPSDPWIWDNYAVFCQETRRFEDAVSAYEKRLSFDGSDPRTYNDLAAVLHHDLERDLDRCAELYKKCIAMADEELKRNDLTDERRQHVTEARRVAQDNLDQLEPPKGLLDSVLEGLGSIELPELPQDPGGGTDSDDGGGGDQDS